MQITKYVRDTGFNNLIIGLTNSHFDNEKDFITSGADYVMGKPISVSSINMYVQHLYNEGSVSMPDKTLKVKNGMMQWVPKVL